MDKVFIYESGELTFFYKKNNDIQYKILYHPKNEKFPKGSIWTPNMFKDDLNTNSRELQKWEVVKYRMLGYDLSDTQS